MQQIVQGRMLVGIDVHKDTHTAVGVSPFGEKLFELTVGNYQKDFVDLTAKVEAAARDAKLSPYFGLEDCHGYGERLATYLDAVGYSVVQVASTLVDRQRHTNTHPEKSDSLDAQGVAEVMLRKSDKLPRYTVTEASTIAKDIKDVAKDRENLVLERTRLKNQLHDLLHRIWNTAYREKFIDPFSQKAMRYWSRAQCKDASLFLMRTMKRKVRRLQALHIEIKELDHELVRLVKESGNTIATASGCGVVVASTIIAEIGDINRFRSPGALAKYAGCAPREYGSGKKQRYRKSRSGNRRLNSAFHLMALTQISPTGNDKARAYFRKKISEGKTKSQALVYLRRQLVNVIWCMLKYKTVYRS
ncbi:MAG TPA: IS110 family transposase [Candidatus Paceibacterota bacterium]